MSKPMEVDLSQFKPEWITRQRKDESPGRILALRTHHATAYFFARTLEEWCHVALHCLTIIHAGDAPLGWSFDDAEASATPCPPDVTREQAEKLPTPQLREQYCDKWTAYDRNCREARMELNVLATARKAVEDGDPVLALRAFMSHMYRGDGEDQWQWEKVIDVTEGATSDGQ